MYPFGGMFRKLRNLSPITLIVLIVMAAAAAIFAFKRAADLFRLTDETTSANDQDSLATPVAPIASSASGDWDSKNVTIVRPGTSPVADGLLKCTVAETSPNLTIRNLESQKDLQLHDAFSFSRTQKLHISATPGEATSGEAQIRCAIPAGGGDVVYVLSLSRGPEQSVQPDSAWRIEDAFAVTLRSPPSWGPVLVPWAVLLLVLGYLHRRFARSSAASEEPPSELLPHGGDSDLGPAQPDAAMGGGANLGNEQLSSGLALQEIKNLLGNVRNEIGEDLKTYLQTSGSVPLSPDALEKIREMVESAVASGNGKKGVGCGGDLGADTDAGKTDLPDDTALDAPALSTGTAADRRLNGTDLLSEATASDAPAPDAATTRLPATPSVAAPPARADTGFDAGASPDELRALRSLREAIRDPVPPPDEGRVRPLLNAAAGLAVFCAAIDRVPGLPTQSRVRLLLTDLRDLQARFLLTANGLVRSTRPVIALVEPNLSPSLLLERVAAEVKTDSVSLPDENIRSIVSKHQTAINELSLTRDENDDWAAVLEPVPGVVQVNAVPKEPFVPGKHVARGTLASGSVENALLPSYRISEATILPAVVTTRG